MCRKARITVFTILLAAMLLGPVLTGCSFSVNKEFGLGDTTASAPTTTAAPAATVAPTQKAASTPTRTATPKVASTPTRTATPKVASTPTRTATPTPGTAQTITQEIVVHSSSDEGGISAQGTFTMTAQIQVGVVDGINLTSEAVPMPAGAKPYVATSLPKIGDAVQGADGLLVQVTGKRTVDAGADMQFVLVDLVVGNAGQERQLVATDPCMEIVSGDGHWYSASWLGLYWLATGGEEYATAKGQDLHDKLLKNKVTSDFSVALDPGQAAKGTAVFPVPKSAKQLAFGFQSYLASTYLFFSNEANPTIFVPLDLAGTFPTIPANVAPLDAKKTYKVGESLKANKRGVAFQVQSAWKRLEALGNMFPLEPSEQFVVVNVLAPAGAGVKPLDQTRELALVDGNGKAFALQEYASDWLTLRLGQFNQRGVLVFKGPRAATGLKLKFTPLDPATMGGDSPKPLTAEAATIDLGTIPAAAAVPVPTPKPAATRQPTPTKASSTDLQLGDRVEAGSLAITVNGYAVDSAPAEGFEAGEGNTWVIAMVAIENIGNADVWIDPESFDFVDKAGVVYTHLLNKPSSWDKIRKNVIEAVELAAGGTLEDRVLAIKIEEEAVPGLKLRYTAEDGSKVVWDLGIQ